MPTSPWAARRPLSPAGPSPAEKVKQLSELVPSEGLAAEEETTMPAEAARAPEGPDAPQGQKQPTSTQVFTGSQRREQARTLSPCLVHSPGSWDSPWGQLTGADGGTGLPVPTLNMGQESMTARGCQRRLGAMMVAGHLEGAAAAVADRWGSDKDTRGSGLRTGPSGPRGQLNPKLSCHRRTTCSLEVGSAWPRG